MFSHLVSIRVVKRIFLIDLLTFFFSNFHVGCVGAHNGGQRTVCGHGFLPSPCGIWVYSQIIRLSSKPLHLLRHFVNPPPPLRQNLAIYPEGPKILHPPVSVFRTVGLYHHVRWEDIVKLYHRGFGSGQDSVSSIVKSFLLP